MSSAAPTALIRPGAAILPTSSGVNRTFCGIIEQEELVENAWIKGSLLQNELQNLAGRHSGGLRRSRARAFSGV